MQVIHIVLYLLAGACSTTAISLAIGIDLNASMSGETLLTLAFPIVLSIGMVYAHYYFTKKIHTQGRNTLYFAILIILSAVLTYMHYVTFKYMGFDNFRLFVAVFALPVLTVIDLGGLSAIAKYFK